MSEASIGGDTGEQGVDPAPPEQRDGVGAGLVPDDTSEGRAERAELSGAALSTGEVDPSVPQEAEKEGGPG